MARSFREAEEASNAQGMTQAALNYALQQAKKNPTPENIAIAKDTAAARQATIAANDPGKLVPTVTIGGAPAGYMPQVLVEAQASARATQDAIAEVERAKVAVDVAGEAAGLISQSMGGPAYVPIVTPAQDKTKADVATSDAVYAALIARMSIYGINNLAETIARIRRENPSATSDELLLLLRNDSRYNKDYLNRFSANKTLIAAGKAPLDEQTYLANEQAYEKLFKSYNLKEFMNRDKYSMLIANEVSPTEAGTRVAMAYDRVLSDPNTADVFKRYYPGLTTSAIVATLLDPNEQLPELKKRVTAAEIGGAALRQGLDVAAAASFIQSQRYKNLTQGTIGYETLQAQGVTKEEAVTGYQKIAELLPRAEFLSSITGGEDYTQAQAEQEQFMGLASAKRARQAISATEIGRFSGTSGRYQSKNRAAGLI